MMTRQEKEEYLVATCDKYNYRKDTEVFRKGVSKLSDRALDVKIKTLGWLLEDMEDGSEDDV